MSQRISNSSHGGNSSSHASASITQVFYTTEPESDWLDTIGCAFWIILLLFLLWFFVLSRITFDPEPLKQCTYQQWIDATHYRTWQADCPVE
ncbi:MAG: hypothetical protein J0I79_16370 [Mesorhizobium sp.]|uniref:hypothetical protein n=1 Tax=Mesorhizobium sp. TaxID=1871066 RepID=UPI001ACB3EA7|nr:hypothetical protein [Mesorhizobium sp.]MBN9219521.1 hypothetical protein [Mesorhizobium sp.]